MVNSAKRIISQNKAFYQKNRLILPNSVKKRMLFYAIVDLPLNSQNYDPI